ncbi:MAG TPA: hypothetical protein VFJ91_12680 [Gaiellaceae bacterium]|nr:hypothetical protein [Gaiellaceae bacterium]
MKGLLALALASGVAAHPALKVSPATAHAGAKVTVSGNAGMCPRGDQVVAISKAFPGHAYGQGTLSGKVGAGGAFSFAGHLRSGVKAGRYAVTARCGGGNLGVVAYVRVR